MRVMIESYAHHIIKAKNILHVKKKMTNYLLNCISCKSTAATSSKNCTIDRDNIIRVIKHILNFVTGSIMQHIIMYE